MTPEDRLRHMIESARDRGGEGRGWTEFAGRAHRALFWRRAALASGAVALVAMAALSAVVVTGELDPDRAPVLPADSPTGSGEPSREPSPPSSSPSADPSPTADASAEISPFEAELWFVTGERLSFGTTILPNAEPGTVSAAAAPGSPEQRAAVVLEALVAGPTSMDTEAGATTAIPEGTRLLGFEITNDGKASIATVDLSREFESGGGSLSMQLRVAQVVYTATQVEGVNSIRIAIEGRTADTLGGEGLMIDSPMDRSDFGDVAPPIVLEYPTIGSRLSAPIVVSGYANVFEATVNLQVLDENGKVLTETFATATCGSGCRGRFVKKVRFGVDYEQQGRVVALTYSAEDGSPQDQISIPVTLVP